MGRPVVSPISRIGSGDPDRKPGFCPNRLSKLAKVGVGRKGEEEERLPESLLAPSNVHAETPWVPTRAQPWNSNLTAVQFTNTSVVGTPRRGHFDHL